MHPPVDRLAERQQDQLRLHERDSDASRPRPRVGSCLRARDHARPRRRRAADTPVELGLDGVYSPVDDLRLRCPLVPETEIGATPIDRYLKPVAELGAFGDDLTPRFSVPRPRTAKSNRALGIHPNTLRHRLERFAQPKNSRGPR